MLTEKDWMTQNYGQTQELARCITKAYFKEKA